MYLSFSVLQALGYTLLAPYKIVVLSVRLACKFIRPKKLCLVFISICLSHLLLLEFLFLCVRRLSAAVHLGVLYVLKFFFRTLMTTMMMTMLLLFCVNNLLHHRILVFSPWMIMMLVVVDDLIVKRLFADLCLPLSHSPIGSNSSISNWVYPYFYCSAQVFPKTHSQLSVAMLNTSHPFISISISSFCLKAKERKADLLLIRLFSISACLLSFSSSPFADRKQEELI